MAIRSFTCISDVTRRLPTGRAYWISGSQVLYRLAAFLSRHSRAPPAGCTEYSAQSMMCPSSGEGGAWDCGDPFLSFHAVQRGRHLPPSSAFHSQALCMRCTRAQPPPPPSPTFTPPPQFFPPTLRCVFDTVAAAALLGAFALAHHTHCCYLQVYSFAFFFFLLVPKNVEKRVVEELRRTGKRRIYNNIHTKYIQYIRTLILS